MNEKIKSAIYIILLLVVVGVAFTGMKFLYKTELVKDTQIEENNIFRCNLEIYDNSNLKAINLQLLNSSYPELPEYGVCDMIRNMCLHYEEKELIQNTSTIQHFWANFNCTWFPETYTCECYNS